MASIRKATGWRTPFWYCCLTLPDLRRVSLSTKLEDKRLARDICTELGRLSDKVETNSANEASAKKCIESVKELTERLPAKQRKIVEEQARKNINLILESVGESPLKNISTRIFLEEWLAAQKQTTAPSTYLRYKVVIDAFLKLLGATADAALGSITARHIEAFKALQIKEGKSAGTVNTNIKILRMPLTQARKQNYISYNPAEAVSRLKKAPNAREPFTLEQVNKLLTKISELNIYKDWIGMVLLGFYRGLRISDAANLQWKNIDLDKGLLTYTSKKTENHTPKPSSVPLPSIVVDYFRSLPMRGIGSAPVFQSLYGKSAKGNSGLSRTFEYLVELAGIDRKELTEGKRLGDKGRKFFALGFHSLRHTCTSQMANLGIDKEMRMQIVGHASSDVHEKYTHHETERQREALDKLPKLKVQ